MFTKGTTAPRLHYAQHNQRLCAHTEPLCGQFPLKKLLQNNFNNPMFTRGPPTPFTTTLWLHDTTVWVYFSLKITRNYCFGQFIRKNHWKTTLNDSMVIRGHPSLVEIMGVKP